MLQQAAALVPERGLAPKTEVATILRELAEAEVGARQFERALDYYRQAAELHPSSTATPELAVAQSLVREAESYVATGSDEAALDAYRQAAEFAPAGLIVPEAELALRQAIKFVQAEQLEDAVMWLRQAVILNPALEQSRATELVWPYFEICQRLDESHKSLDRASICGQAASAAATTDSVDLNWPVCQWGLASDLAAAVRPACIKTDALSQALSYGETRLAQMPVASDMAWYFAAKALQSAQITLSGADDVRLVAAVYSPAGTMLGQTIMGGELGPAIIRFSALPEAGTYRIIVARSLRSVALPAADAYRITVKSFDSPAIALPSGISTLGPANTVSGDDIVYRLTLNSVEEP